MTGYTQVFGSTTIYPSKQTFLSLAMSTDQTLVWPIEQQVSGNVVADIIEVNASAGSLSITLPDARQVSTGFTALFNNVGSNTVSIKNSTGTVLVSLTNGTAWQLYLSDNSTAAGTWKTFQYGAGTSTANAAALAGYGIKAISTTLNQSMPVTSTSTTPSTFVDADRGKLIVWTGGAGTFNLPSAATVGSDWFIVIRNGGTGTLSVVPPSGTIDGSATKNMATTSSAIVASDGTNYFTIGYGLTASSSSFDYLAIAVAGTGNYTLAGAELSRISYKFTGILTGTRTIIVPATLNEYWVDNSTTGAFSLYLKTVAQAAPGIEVTQSQRAILYCDGTDVKAADTSAATYPVAVSLGGTGSSTAPGALTNLGADAKYLPFAGGTMSGDVNHADYVVQRPELKDYSETKTAPTIAAGVLTLDLTNGNVFEVALNANITTLNFNNPSPTGKACSFTLIFTADGTGRTVAWPGAVKWAGGTTPTLTSTNGKKDIFSFMTVDAGTNWYGFTSGKNF
jgi:hypothetical protein